MQVTAHLSNARLTSRKMRQLVPVVINLPANEAMAQLLWQPGKAAAIVRKLLKSALANAKTNLSLEADNLRVASLIVGEGIKFKRFRPVSRGSAHPFVKRNAHVTVILEEINQSEPTMHRKRKTDIQTLTVEDLDVGSHKLINEKVSEKAPKIKNPEGVHVDPKLEAYQKIKMQQKSGDQKKTHRRKSM